jgi:predicted ABC-type ATPase
MKPQLVVLAGPNGAGKSTFYDVFLSESELLFLNADRFAAETGVDSFDAARILDETRARMIKDGIGFITETVFSDPHGAKLTMLESAVEAGYEVTLIYIGAGSAELLARRVDQRIARGGHDVPRDRIASRFERSLRNLKSALSLVTKVKLFDNSDADEPYRHVATFDHGSLTFRGKGRLPAWTRGLLPPARRRRKR